MNNFIKQNFSSQSIIQIIIIVLTLTGISYVMRFQINNHEVRIKNTEDKVTDININLAGIKEKVEMIYDIVKGK